MAGDTARTPLPISEVLERVKPLMQSYNELDAVCLMQEIGLWGIVPDFPTLASLLTPEEAGRKLEALCFGISETIECGFDCGNNGDFGFENHEPPPEAKLCRALWELCELAKENP